MINIGKFEEEKALLSVQWSDEKKIKEVGISKSVTDCIKTESATLATVKKYQGEVILNAAIHSLLYDLKNFFSVGNGMNDRQIELLAQLIFKEYYFLTILDLKFCFERAMVGDFGKLYNRLDGGIIMGWIAEFSEQKQSKAEELNILKSNESKSDQSGVSMPDWFAEYLDKRFKKTQKEEILKLSSQLIERFKDVHQKMLKDGKTDLSFDDFLNKQLGGRKYKLV